MTHKKGKQMEIKENEQKYIHICEVCGKVKLLTPEQAFDEGWDYPPKMGAFGILSPRTCGDCAMTDTLWWAIQNGAIKSYDDLSEKQRALLERIGNEPESIMPIEPE